MTKNWGFDGDALARAFAAGQQASRALAIAAGLAQTGDYTISLIHALALATAMASPTPAEDALHGCALLPSFGYRMRVWATGPNSHEIHGDALQEMLIGISRGRGEARGDALGRAQRSIVDWCQGD